jgi:hypothetical protein
MNAYTLVLFLHIVGALGFFVALSVEWLSLRSLRRATTAERAREWLQLSTGARRLGMASMILILLAGGTLMIITGMRDAWLFVSLGTFLLVAVLAAALTMRRMAAIKRALTAEQGSLSPHVSQVVQHPLLWLSIQTRLALTLSIVFLMTVKPDLGPSLLLVGLAAVIGLIAGMPQVSSAHTGKEAAV